MSCERQSPFDQPVRETQFRTTDSLTGSTRSWPKRPIPRWCPSTGGEGFAVVAPSSPPLAASLVLVGGTAAVTESLSQGVVSPAAVPAPHGSSLRTGTFETADGQVMGQIVASQGNPSWVYLDVAGTNYNGSVVCKLQVKDGSTVATGVFGLHGGKGVLSKSVRVNVGQLRGAKLVTPSGTVVASATFA